jgi:hypothetical protein
VARPKYPDRTVVARLTRLVMAVRPAVAQMDCHRTDVVRVGVAMAARQAATTQDRHRTTVRPGLAAVAPRVASVKIRSIPMSLQAMDGIDWRTSQLTRITANHYRSIGISPIIQPILV